MKTSHPPGSPASFHSRGFAIALASLALWVTACGDDDSAAMASGTGQGSASAEDAGETDGAAEDTAGSTATATAGGTAGDDAASDDAGTQSAGTAGDATEGEATEGDATEGEATEGEATEGEATAGDATEGEATEGDATAGDATTGEATAGDTDSAGTGGGDGDANVCDDPSSVYADTCQICGVQTCCAEYESCMDDPTCACWFACMGSVYDENECVLQCGASAKMGPLLGCMASDCNDACVHWDSPSLAAAAAGV